ncbi:coiled-coil and C2 domain-containing protein 2A-like [Homarus americanus]|uniref:coiled-coil and C2 domain-containing protein 2A-like n=1 Tax=Homarus americanus TaxID=6706 RepID=UPI001C485F6E|nr:coiled-coil and C2 domain-containing protein 2A-like [Homarus americanus]
MSIAFLAFRVILFDVLPRDVRGDFQHPGGAGANGVPGQIRRSPGLDLGDNLNNLAEVGSQLKNEETTKFREYCEGKLLQARAASRIESEDFFIRVWPEEQVKPTPLGKWKGKTSPVRLDSSHRGVVPKTPPSSPKERTERDDTSEDVIDEEESEELALVGPPKQLVTHLVPAQYVSYNKRCFHDEETLFLPSPLPSDVHNKIDADVALRNLADEGLYIGEKPYITQTNLNITENRFLRQGSRHWFTETGSLERLDNPISEQIYHHLPSDFETQLEPLTVFVHPHSSECLSTSQDDGGVLDVELSQLTFTHHPLFSPEHVLASQLTQAYNTYVERVAASVTKILQNKLVVLRQSLAKLRQIRPESKRQHKSVHEEIDSVRRLEIYRQEIRECREEFIAEAERDRVLLTNILKLWKNIKHLRRGNKYHSTAHKLIIKKEDVSKEDEEERRKEELEEEVKELLEVYEEDYTKKMTKYEKAITEWKTARKKRKEAKKHQQQRQKSALGEDLESSILQAAQDDTILSTPEAAKPQPPKPVDKHKVELEVLEVFSHTRRPPGEPIIQLELTQSSSVTENNHCPEQERRRRQAVGKLKLWVKVLINNKLVTQTSSASLGNDFTLHLGQTYRMALSSWPRSVVLEVTEGTSLRQTLVATAFLPVPSKTNTFKDMFDTVEFSGKQVISHNHEGVGCGLADSEYGSSFTCGLMRYRLGWALGDDGEILSPVGPPPAALTGHSPVRSHLHPRADPTIAKRWLEDARIDPNDPSNVALVSHLQKAASGKSKPNNYFEIDRYEGDFCTNADLDASVRLRVLQLRAQEVPEFKGLKLIPAIESEVLRKTLEKYENKAAIGTEHKETTELESGVLWGLDQRWERTGKLLASLRRNMQQRYSPTNVAPKLKDLVQEESIPDIGTLGTSLLSVFKPRRPLKPRRKKRDQVRGAGLVDPQVQLIVHIARAFHVPVRHDSSRNTSAEQSQSTDVIQGSSLVRPFIEATFQRTVLRTSVAEGPNPTWNQQLSFPFRAPNDTFSSKTLQTVTDNVYLHLFDEVIHDLLEDDRMRDSTVHHRIEKCWLGSLKIPFSTIYSNTKIEGTFSLEEPVVLLGYSRDTTSAVNMGAHRPQGEPSRSTTHLSIYITLEPTLPPPEPIKAQFESSEPEEVLAASRDWVASLSSRYSRRKFRTHVLDLSGKLLCLNRFIRPLKPPNELIGENPVENAHRLAWYISLIPSLADMTLFPGACDIWANSEQFLTMLTGDEEEHAVLLTNFFLHIGKTAFLLLGSGIPEGETCYVLTLEDNGSWLVWNPSTAQCFGATDAFSPLSAVYMLVDQDNIWANVQKYDDPPRVNFDVHGSGWRSLFSRSQPDPGLPSVQPQRLTFHPVDTSQMDQLKERLEILLRDAIMKWRSSQRTPWNRHAIMVLRKLVHGLEEPRASGKDTSPDLTQLATIMTSHKVCGVCVHQGYSTMASVVEAVHSTGIHLTQSNDAEFALALHLKPYPASIISVWVYVASLVKRM